MVMQVREVECGYLEGCGFGYECGGMKGMEISGQKLCGFLVT